MVPSALSVLIAYFLANFFRLKATNNSKRMSTHQNC